MRIPIDPIDVEPARVMNNPDACIHDGASERCRLDEE
jgi:hypothetical protein